MNARSPEFPLSIIVLTRNRLDMLRRCIASVLGQQRQDFEIVILDDASDGVDTAQAISHEFADPRIRPYRSQSSRGVAGGRNFLMEKARGEILVTIDDDAVFADERALDQVCAAFDHDPGIGVVAFKIINVVNGERFVRLPFRRPILFRKPMASEHATYASAYVGAGHAVAKQVIDHCGGYRNDMIFGEEELDLAYRIIQAGYRILFDPAIEVNHYPMPSVVSNAGTGAPSELYCHVRNRAYLAYRYLPWKYIVPYVSIWMTRYAVGSLRSRCVSEFVRGLLAVPAFLQGTKRHVLDPEALAYLRRYGGRLWY